MRSEVSHREDTSLPDLGVATTRTNSFLLEVITKNILLSNGSVGWLADLLGFPLASRSAFSQFSFEPAPDPGVKKQLWFNSSRNSHKLVVGPLAPQSTFQNNSNNNNTNANEVSTHTNKQASKYQQLRTTPISWSISWPRVFSSERGCKTGLSAAGRRMSYNVLWQFFPTKNHVLHRLTHNKEIQGLCFWFSLHTRNGLVIVVVVALVGHILTM